MIRLLGAITGSALAVALLLLVIGIPQFRAPDDGAREEIVTLPLPTRPVDDSDAAGAAGPADVALADVAAEPLVDDPGIDDPVPDDLPGPAESAAPADIETMDPFELAERSASTPTVARDIPELPDLATAPPTEPQWYTFWSPFRSEIAANGFVERLQSVTGLDYRIVRVKPGVYEVSFAYREDNEIPGNLSRITAATGLDLSER